MVQDLVFRASKAPEIEPAGSPQQGRSPTQLPLIIDRPTSNTFLGVKQLSCMRLDRICRIAPHNMDASTANEHEPVPSIYFHIHICALFTTRRQCLCGEIALQPGDHGKPLHRTKDQFLQVGCAKVDGANSKCSQKLILHCLLVLIIQQRKSHENNLNICALPAQKSQRPPRSTRVPPCLLDLKLPSASRYVLRSFHLHCQRVGPAG